MRKVVGNSKCTPKLTPVVTPKTQGCLSEAFEESFSSFAWIRQSHLSNKRKEDRDFFNLRDYMPRSQLTLYVRPYWRALHEGGFLVGARTLRMRSNMLSGRSGDEPAPPEEDLAMSAELEARRIKLFAAMERRYSATRVVLSDHREWGTVYPLDTLASSFAEVLRRDVAGLFSNVDVFQKRDGAVRDVEGVGARGLLGSHSGEGGGGGAGGVLEDAVGFFSSSLRGGKPARSLADDGEEELGAAESGIAEDPSAAGSPADSSSAAADSSGAQSVPRAGPLTGRVLARFEKGPQTWMQLVQYGTDLQGQGSAAAPVVSSQRSRLARVFLAEMRNPVCNDVYRVGRFNRASGAVGRGVVGSEEGYQEGNQEGNQEDQAGFSGRAGQGAGVSHAPASYLAWELYVNRQRVAVLDMPLVSPPEQLYYPQGCFRFVRSPLLKHAFDGKKYGEENAVKEALEQNEQGSTDPVASGHLRLGDGKGGGLLSSEDKSPWSPFGPLQSPAAAQEKNGKFTDWNARFTAAGVPEPNYESLKKRVLLDEDAADVEVFNNFLDKFRNNEKELPLINAVITLCARRDVVNKKSAAAKAQMVLPDDIEKIFNLELDQEQILRVVDRVFTENRHLKFMHLTHFVPELHFDDIIVPMIRRMGYFTNAEVEHLELYYNDYLRRSAGL